MSVYGVNAMYTFAHENYMARPTEAYHSLGCNLIWRLDMLFIVSLDW